MDHYEESLAALDLARAAREQLDRQFAGNFRDNARINDLQAKVGFAMKVADIHSNLAIADSIDALAEEIVRARGSRVVDVELSELKPEFVDDLAVPFVPAVEL